MLGTGICILNTIDLDALQTAQMRSSSKNEKNNRVKAVDATGAAWDLLDPAQKIVFIEQVHDEALRKQGGNVSKK